MDDIRHTRHLVARVAAKILSTGAREQGGVVARRRVACAWIRRVEVIGKRARIDIVQPSPIGHVFPGMPIPFRQVWRGGRVLVGYPINKGDDPWARAAGGLEVVIVFHVTERVVRVDSWPA